MNWQEFENGLKNRVGEHETPLDTEALWGRLQQKKRRRRVLFWWWFGGACLLAGSAGLLLWQGKDSGSVPQMAVTPDLQTEMVRSIVPQHEPVAAQQAVASGLQESQASTTTAPAATISKAGNPNTLPGRNTSTERNPETADKPFAQSTGVTNAAPAPVPLTIPTENTGPDPLYAIEQMDNQSVVLSIPLLAVIPELVYSTDPEKPFPPFIPSIAPPSIPSIEPVRSTFQVGLQTGVSYWNVLQNPSADPTLPRTNERRLEAFNIGLYVQKPVAQRWAVRAGIQYQRFNSVFNWQTSWTNADQAQQVLNYYENGDIDTTYLPGALIETTRTVRHHNRNTAITLPLDLKYRIPFRRGTLQPFVGIQPGFFQQAVGVILDEQGRPDYGLFPDVYQRKFGLGVRAGISMEWRINGRYSILLEPTGSLDLLSRTARFNPEYEQFWQVGLNVGIVRTMGGGKRVP